MPKYVITKQFRDVSGVRFPGEIIELTPSRTAVLRDSGLIGDEYVPKQQKSEVGEIKEEVPKEAPKPKKGQRKAGK